MMFKKLIMTAAVALVLLTMWGCQSQQRAVWFYGDEELTAARLGVYIDDVTEVGGVAAWFPRSDENVDLYGIYGLHYLDAVKVSNPFEPGSETMLEAVPYVGAQSIFDLDYDVHVFTVTGLTFANIFFVEHQYDAFDNSESRTMVGVRIRF